MGFDTWENKMKLIIDSSKVDDDLLNFPILISVISGTGITDYDATDLFDQLDTVSSGNSWDNRKKIAITTTVSGVEIELYVEIEHWDKDNKQATLWTKIPELSSNANTELYLYYDPSKPTNSGHIGDIGDDVAKQVWDDNFVGVWHMSQDPSGGAGCILDSTSNGNDGTPYNMNLTNMVSGTIGTSLNFNGVDEYVACGVSGILNPQGGNFTIESMITTSGNGNNDLCIVSKGTEGDNPMYNMIVTNDGHCLKTTIEGTGDEASATATTNIIDNILHHAAVVIDRTAGERPGIDDIPFSFTEKGYTAPSFLNVPIQFGLSSSQQQALFIFYVDGSNDGGTGLSFTSDSVGNIEPTQEFRIGRYNSAPNEYYFNGIIDEVRISNVDRSRSWMKTTYYSNTNNLITFSPGGWSHNFMGVVNASIKKIAGVAISYIKSVLGIETN
jgi:hypothetical protein